MPIDNNKIAANTAFLYLRKVVSLVISLYTSRIVLEMLGVTEFGIYGLVGSIVAIFSALRGLFASSIQRYININKGCENGIDIGDIFSIGLEIHIGISIIFFILVEITGWLMIPHLNIPPENFNIAQWVLLLSVLSTVVSILTVPFDALIIANERFKAYAVISLIENILRLGIVFLLAFSPFSRVVYYSLLVLIASIIVRFINTVYCRREFGDESKYRNVKNKKLLIEMTKFAGWQFFGNLGFTVTNNGINFLINIFGGVTANAARTIAYQVMQAVQQFVADISVSFQPQSMILFAQNKKDEFFKLIILNSKTSISIALILSFPILMMTRSILTLWLGDIPKYTVSFVQCILFYLLIRAFHGPIDMLFKCDGNLKKYQLTECIIMLFNLPITWIALKFNYPYYYAFLIMGFVEILNFIVILIIAEKQTGFDAIYYSKTVLLPSGIAILILISTFALKYKFCILDEPIGVLNSIIYFSFSMIFASLIVLMIIFNKTEKDKLISIIVNKINRK